jgi:hypothetical protein
MTMQLIPNLSPSLGRDTPARVTFQMAKKLSATWDGMPPA